MSNLFLLPIFLIPMFSLAPELNQDNNPIVFKHIQTSTDIVDLTMSSNGKAITNLPNYTKLLINISNNNLEGNLTNIGLSLVNSNNNRVGWMMPTFDVFTLYSILKEKENQSLSLELEVSANYSNHNYINITYNSIGENCYIVGRFDYDKFDMSSYWNKDVRANFELFFL